MKLPYIVLGIYNARRWRASVIGPELCELTRKLGLAPHYSPAMLAKLEKASWRDLDQHASVVRYAIPQYEGSGWHQDGDNSPGANMDCGLVLWCDREPTQIRGADGVVHQPRPHEIVLFRNLECYHRRPPEVVGKRWLFRQRVSPKWNF